MFLAFPWMLLGLLALPALTAIYWLRSRSRKRTVSSLFLWSEQRRPRQGGRVIQKLQTPMTFFLEFLALAAIAIAATGPEITRRQITRPLVLVLDNSYSMTAGRDENALQRAKERIRAELGKTNYVARVILAGTHPHLLGEILRSPADWESAADAWTGSAATAAIEPAIALAVEIGGTTSRILVLSDHPPDFQLPAEKLQWWSVGVPEANLAITNATRDLPAGGDADAADRVLLEVSNFSKTSVRTQWILTGAGFDRPQRHPLDLDAGEVSRIVMEVPAGSAPLQADLEDDALARDNRAILVSPRHRRARVKLSLGRSPGSDQLSKQVTRAVAATGQAVVVASEPDLLITDQADAASNVMHTLVILSGPEPVSFEGPFVLDRSHPLTEGLSLDAVIWSTGRDVQVDGTPIVMAGNRVLMATSENAEGQERIEMAFSADLSNLLASADWPILIANLVRRSLADQPGPETENVRLNQPLPIELPNGIGADDPLVLTPPAQQPRKLLFQNRTMELIPDQIGIYDLQAGTSHFQFACNALSASESNLLGGKTADAGSWDDSELYQDERLSLSWVFILLALGCLSMEMFMLSRAGGLGL